MTPIHVLVSGAAGLMREIVTQAIAQQPDMTLIGTTDDVSLGALDESRGTDVIVVLLDSNVASVDAALRRTFASCAVVAVSGAGRGAWSYDYELRRAAESIAELSPEALIAAIRESAHRIAARASTPPAEGPQT